MPKPTQQDHHCTAYYIPKYYRNEYLSTQDRKIFKMLYRRLIQEGRVIEESFLENTNIPQIFSTIKFDCLLHIDEQICPVFIFEFYKSVRIIRNDDETISLSFIINKQTFTLPLTVFADILRIPCEGICMYSKDWSIANQHLALDPSPIYRTPLDDPILVRDTIFTKRTNQSRPTRNKKIIHRYLFQMELFEMLPTFKKWEEILRENVIYLVGK